MSNYRPTCNSCGSGFFGGFGQDSNCACSLPTLIILILIILQFGRRSNYSHYYEDD